MVNLQLAKKKRSWVLEKRKRFLRWWWVGSSKLLQNIPQEETRMKKTISIQLIIYRKLNRIRLKRNSSPDRELILTSKCVAWLQSTCCCGRVGDSLRTNQFLSIARRRPKAANTGQSKLVYSTYQWMWRGSLKNQRWQHFTTTTMRLRGSQIYQAMILWSTTVRLAISLWSTGVTKQLG